MENIWKAVLGVFISVLIVFSGLGILEANNCAAAAEQYLYAVGSELSAANFAGAVCMEKEAEAAERSYLLTVEPVSAGNGRSSHIAYAVLTLEYPYEIALLRLHTTQRKQLIVY